MSTVRLEARCRACDADLAYRRLADFRGYPEATETVLGVEVEQSPEGQVSIWEVRFREGVLRWSEYDQLDARARRIDFRQRDGDPASFEGTWAVSPEEQGCRVSFTAKFDLGMPSFAAVVEPLAARTLLDNMAAVVRHMIDADAAFVTSHELDG